MVAFVCTFEFELHLNIIRLASTLLGERGREGWSKRKGTSTAYKRLLHCESPSNECQAWWLMDTIFEKELHGGKTKERGGVWGGGGGGTEKQ